MEIIEHQLIGKTGALTACEDSWTVTDGFACVIDGATSKGDLNFGQQTSGRMASLLIKDSIKKLPADATCNDAVIFLTEQIAKFCKDRGLYSSLSAKHWNRLAASVAIYSKQRREVWLIGDAQCWVNGQWRGVPKAIDTMLAGMRANYLKALIKTGSTLESLLEKDAGREFILPMLKTQSQYQNAQPDHPYAYTVIDGFSPNPNGIKSIPVESDEVVLATDGYPKLFPTLEDSESYLAKVLSEDPLCFKLFPSTKGRYAGQRSFDDRAYLRLHV